MDLSYYSEEDLQININSGKDCFVAKMVRDGVITGEQGKIMSEQYMLTIIKPNRLGKMMKDFLKMSDGDKSRIICVKV